MSQPKIIDVTPQQQADTAERQQCEACTQRRQHTAEEWKNHPNAGTGQAKS